MPSGYPFLTIFIFYPQEATCKDQGLNQTYLFKLGLTGKEATPIFENFFCPFIFLHCGMTYNFFNLTRVCQVSLLFVISGRHGN